jgi:hypothetical protein
LIKKVIVIYVDDLIVMGDNDVYIFLFEEILEAEV